MRAQVLATLGAMALLLPPTGIAVAADTPPPPPTIVPYCATDKEYVWSIKSTATGLANYNIDYTTKLTADWADPHGGTIGLALRPNGDHGRTVWTTKADGTSLFVRWSSFPDQVASSSTPSTTPCAMASLTVKRVVQGGKASADKFPVSIVRRTTSFVDPALSESMAVPVTPEVTQSLQSGSYRVGPAREGAAYLPLPAGYVFRSHKCVIHQPGLEALLGGTTDARYQGMVAYLAPGASGVCTITYHYGPVLDDTIAAGKKTSGTAGFGTATVTVRKGTWVTYLVTTSPSLAGKKVQIWTKTGARSKPWKLTKTVTVASNGSVRYYATVTGFTGFLAKWPGNSAYVASAAVGRYVTVK